jgi:hypothetical protein
LPHVALDELLELTFVRVSAPREDVGRVRVQVEKGMGAGGDDPVDSSQVVSKAVVSVVTAKAGERHWLDGLYLDVPEEWDDPYVSSGGDSTQVIPHQDSCPT